MSDVCVTIPQERWAEWLTEGDLPGDEWSGRDSHYTIWPGQSQHIYPGDRCYIVSWGRLRGYAPIVKVEERCLLDPRRACILRRGGAVAVTVPFRIQGFRGLKFRYWERHQEIDFPNWKTEGVYLP